jgi:hypothetical protein
MDQQQHREAYEEACQDIAEVERRLERLKTVAEWHKEKMACQDGADANGAPEPERGHVAGPATRRFLRAKQSAAARIILGETGEPMKAKAIAEAMIRGGYPQRDLRKLTTSLFTMMTRQKTSFDKVSRGLWALREQPDGDDNEA